MISSDCLLSLGRIADNLDFVIESDHTNLAFTSSIGHVGDLRVDGSLDALDTRDISHPFVRRADELIRSIAELAHLSFKGRQVVSLELVLTSDGLADAH